MAARDIEVPSSKGLYEEMYASNAPAAPTPPAASAREPVPAAAGRGRRKAAASAAAAAPPVETATAAPKEKPKPTSTRPDAEGMRRWSLYSTEASAAAFESAVKRVLAALGEDTPKQVAISALLEYAAAGADTVEADLIDAQTRELEARLAAIKHRG